MNYSYPFLAFCAIFMLMLPASVAQVPSDPAEIQPAYWEHNQGRWETSWTDSAAGKSGQSLELVAWAAGSTAYAGRSTTTFWPGGVSFNLLGLTELSQTIYAPSSAQCAGGGGPRVTMFFEGSAITEARLYPADNGCAETDIWQTMDFLDPRQITGAGSAKTIVDLHDAIVASGPDYRISKIWFQFDAPHEGGIQVDDFTVHIDRAGEARTYLFHEQTDAVCNTAYTDCDSPIGAVIKGAGIGPRTFATGPLSTTQGSTWIPLGDGPAAVPTAFGLTRPWSLTDPGMDCTFVASAGAEWTIVHADDAAGTGAVPMTQPVAFVPNTCSTSSATTLPSAGVLPAGKFLLLRIEAPGEGASIVDPTGLLVHSPDSAAGYPTPNLGSLALLGAGALMVVAAVVIRRAKA